MVWTISCPWHRWCRRHQRCVDDITSGMLPLWQSHTQKHHGDRSQGYSHLEIDTGQDHRALCGGLHMCFGESLVQWPTRYLGVEPDVQQHSRG